QVLFLWIIVGLAIGVFFGKSNRIVRKGKVLFYKQNLILSLVYLAFLLLNQLTVAILKAYIPLLLILAAVAMGVQIGFLLMTLFLVKKPKKAPMILLLILCLACLTPFASVSASSSEGSAEEAPAAEVVAPSIMDITPEEIGMSGISEGNHTAYDELSGGNLGTSLVFDRGKLGNSENGRAFQGGSVRFFNYYRVAAPVGSIYEYGVDGTTVRVYYGIEIYKESTTEELLVQLEAHAAQRAAAGASVSNFDMGGSKAFRMNESSGVVEGVTYMATIEDTLFTMVYTYTRPIASPIENVTTYAPPKMNEAQLDALFGKWTKRIISSEEFATEKNFDKEGEEAAESGHGVEKESGEKDSSGKGGIFEALTNGKNLLELVPVKNKDALLANLAGGLLAGGGMIVFSLFTAIPGNLPLTDEEEEEEVEVFEISKIPGIGMRREDGKYWTKNHGWQDEAFPRFQIEKLERTLSNFAFELEKSTLAEDKMMVDILENEKMLCERERKLWIEDYEACTNTKYQNTLPSDSAANPISWNYKTDLGTMLEDGTFSELAKEKKKITTKQTLMQIIERTGFLSDELSPDLHIINNPVNEKILTEAGVLDAYNAEILHRTGKNKEAMQAVFHFEKTKTEGASDSLKALIAGAEAFAESLLAKKR
ncbi:MAG: hypothetical protein PHC40_06400, partial [Eubacteriales bacterium]|nr:hypothetical protein [Eubacteriales bacterium]